MIAEPELREALAAAARLAEAARRAGWGGALGLGAAGLWLALDGARRRRPIAAVGGAAVGALAAAAAGRWLAAQTGVGAPTLAVLATGIGLAGGAAFPLAFPLALGALPGALLGAVVPLGGSGALGAAVGALVGAAVAFAFASWAAAVAAATLGAALLVGAALAALGPRPAAAELASRPVTLVALVVVLAVAGAAFQAGRAWEPPGRGPPRGGELDATQRA